MLTNIKFKICMVEHDSIKNGLTSKKSSSPLSDNPLTEEGCKAVLKMK